MSKNNSLYGWISPGLTPLNASSNAPNFAKPQIPSRQLSLHFTLLAQAKWFKSLHLMHLCVLWCEEESPFPSESGRCARTLFPCPGPISSSPLVSASTRTSFAIPADPRSPHNCFPSFLLPAPHPPSLEKPNPQCASRAARAFLISTTSTSPCPPTTASPSYRSRKCQPLHPHLPPPTSPSRSSPNGAPRRPSRSSSRQPPAHSKRTSSLSATGTTSRSRKGERASARCTRIS